MVTESAANMQVRIRNNKARTPNNAGNAIAECNNAGDEEKNLGSNANRDTESDT